MAGIINLLRNTHDFLTDRRRVKSELYWIKKVWYLLLLALSSVYVYCNFNTLVNQCFICKLDGNSVIFILWIILLFFPLFNSIEGYGFKFSKERLEQEEQTIKIKVLRDKILKENSIPDIKELEGLFENVISENKDE